MKQNADFAKVSSFLTATLLSLATSALGGPTSNIVKDEVLVKAFNEEPIDIKGLCNLSGATYLDFDQDMNAYRVRVGKQMTVPSTITFFENAPGVEFAQPNYRYDYFFDPNDTLTTSQWYLTRVNFQQAWNVTQGDPGTVVAVIDSGVDLYHPDLQGKLVQGYDFGENDNNPMDNLGHGTRCASIVAANTNNGIGMAGTGFNCRVMPLKASDAAAQLSTWAISRSIWYAAQHGAEVTSMSFGSLSTDPLTQMAIQLNMGRTLFVAGAGNYGNTVPCYPAAYPGVLSVGGSTANDTRHPGSNYGPWVRVAAPGVNIVSATLGGNYGPATGTSYACPIVAGMAGLAFSGLGISSTTGAAYVKEMIEGTCDPVGNWVAKGRVNADAMLNYVPAGMQKFNFAPSAITATYGTLLSGGAFELSRSDDVRVHLQSAQYSGVTHVMAGYTTFRTTYPGTIHEIQVLCENRTDSHGSTTPFYMRLWRWSDSKWIFFGNTQTLTPNDRTILYRQPYNPADFVAPSGEIRVGFQADSSYLFQIQPDYMRLSLITQ